MEGILDRAEQLVSTATKETILDLANLVRWVREDAIFQLKDSLNTSSEENAEVMLILPLTLMEKGRFVEAIWYLETMGNRQIPISWEVVEVVIAQSLDILKGLYESQEDKKWISGLEWSLRLLFKMFKKHPEYTDSPKVILYHAQFEEIRGNIENAIEGYNTLIAEWYEEGYIRAGSVYREVGEMEVAKQIFESGWMYMGNEECLSNLIQVLCILEQFDTAIMRYNELKAIPNTQVAPFVFFKGTIENDHDLEEFERYMMNSLADNVFLGNERLINLSESAREYTSGEVLYENAIIMQMGADFSKEEDYDEQKVQKYIQHSMRRLQLMQTSLFALGNEQFLHGYLSEIHEILIHGNEEALATLWSFFHDHFSKEVWRRFSDESAGESAEEQEDGARKFIPKNTPESFEEFREDMSVYYAAYIHLNVLLDMFFASRKYLPMYRDILGPIFEKIEEKLEGTEEDIHAMLEGTEYDDINEENRIILKDEGYRLYSWDLRKKYEEFVISFDEMYGVFARKRLEEIANIDPLPGESQEAFLAREFPEVLVGNPEAALFLITRKIIIENTASLSDEVLNEQTSRYGLDALSPENTLMFARFLEYISPAYTIGYISSYDEFFDHPETLFVITQSILKLPNDDKKNGDMTQDEAIEILSQITQVREWEMEFLDYVVDRADRILNNPDTPSDQVVHTLIARANALSLRDGEDAIDEILENYKAAGELGFSEAYVTVGDMYSADEDGTEWYEKALAIEENETILHRIIECAMLHKNEQNLAKYMAYAKSQGMEVLGFETMQSLSKEDPYDGLVNTIRLMYKNDGRFYNSPFGILESLEKTLNRVNTTQVPPSRDVEACRIFGSAISAWVSSCTGSERMSVWQKHWEFFYDAVLVDMSDEDRFKRVWTLCSVLQRNISPELLPDETFAQGICRILYEYTVECFGQWENIHADTSDVNEKFAIRKIEYEILLQILLLFTKLPGGSRYSESIEYITYQFLSPTAFVHEMSPTLQ